MKAKLLNLNYKTILQEKLLWNLLCFLMFTHFSFKGLMTVYIVCLSHTPIFKLTTIM